MSTFVLAVCDALRGNIEVPAPVAFTTGGNTDIAVNLGNLSLVVGAEATVDQINRYLDEQSVACAAVPGSGGDRTIGEVVATAAGDERIEIRHGLLGADVTVVDGHTPARFGGENMKDVAGYDTKRLYIGGHGHFGALKTLIFKIAVKG